MNPNALIGRARELKILHSLTRQAGPALVLVYGRRRVGKTTLLQIWARESKLPTFYWEAPRSTAANVRSSLAREFERWQHAGRPGAGAPRFDDWLDLFRHIRQQLGNQKCNLIFDEFPWAVEADTALPSYVKAVWDREFADSRVRLFLTGSHISAMEKLLESDAPLFGRLTGKLLVRPLSLAKIKPFVPAYDPEQRLTVYGIVGGIPDYLKAWDDQANLRANIQEIFISEQSPYRSERSVLISDVLRRDSPDYEAVLEAVGQGKHDLETISLEAGLAGHRAAEVLGVLGDVRLVERRLRASVPPRQQANARYGRYFLSDPFLRFFYRFIQPNRTAIAQGVWEAVDRALDEQLPGFLGETFEELCRAWTLVQARNKGLPFAPDFVGSDWGARHQADVVAVNWREHQVYIGEAKWHVEDFDHQEWRRTVERAEHVITRLKSADPARNPRQEAPDWTRHLVVFTRRGVSPAVRAAVRAANAQIITYADILRDLEKLPEWPEN